MLHLYHQLGRGQRYYLLLLWLLATCTAHAQAPAWNAAWMEAPTTSGPVNGITVARSMAIDASGNVFVTGYFAGTVTFGSTVLTSVGVAGCTGCLLGTDDIFVAKFVPSTGTWAWAQGGGGTGVDGGEGIAVSNGNVYVTGRLYNSSSNAGAVVFGGGPGGGPVQVNGTSPRLDYDLVLAKYIDQGTSGTLAWTQVAGGTGFDVGADVAVSGTSVYVTGSLYNSASNANAVVFGGDGTTPGTVQVNGTTSISSPDFVLAKYLDNGSSATVAWTQIGGGTGPDAGSAIALSGSSVYVLGALSNDTNNTNAVVFGGNGTTAGTTQVKGATNTASVDFLLTKYLDNGPSATLAWTQVGGGTGPDKGNDVAVSGTSVYVTGNLNNTITNAMAVVFGGDGTTAGTHPQYGATATNNVDYDIVLAKYTDQGSSATFGWSQVGGGTYPDTGASIAVSGTSVYVTGSIANGTGNAMAVVFGGSGTTPGTVQVNGATATTSHDILLLKYTDQGASAALQWSQVAGGIDTDQGVDVAVVGQQVYVAGYVIGTSSAAFGSLGLPAIAGHHTVIARVTDAALTPLPVRSSGLAGGLHIYPNPSFGTATLSGLAAGAPVQVLDALGRVVATATADSAGTAPLAAGLVPGVYVVRSDAAATRLVVQ
ncbi:MAG: T9SS type A sorting domain-containing protein [Janthinobacterium lividum]